MGWFSRKQTDGDGKARGGRSSVTLVDDGLPDADWFAESKRVYDADIEGYYGSPDTLAEGGRLHHGHRNFGVAMLFYAKSVDMLQTAYAFSGMRHRQPSPADAWIVNGFVQSLGASLATHPTAPVQEVAEQTAGMLTSIAGECEAVGHPSRLYADAAGAVGRELGAVR